VKESLLLWKPWRLSLGSDGEPAIYVVLAQLPTASRIYKLQLLLLTPALTRIPGPNAQHEFPTDNSKPNSPPVYPTRIPNPNAQPELPPVCPDQLLIPARPPASPIRPIADPPPTHRPLQSRCS
jgi:hypothetical protein